MYRHSTCRWRSFESALHNLAAARDALVPGDDVGVSATAIGVSGVLSVLSDASLAQSYICVAAVSAMLTTQLDDSLASVVEANCSIDIQVSTQIFIVGRWDALVCGSASSRRHSDRDLPSRSFWHTPPIGT